MGCVMKMSEIEQGGLDWDRLERLYKACGYYDSFIHFLGREKCWQMECNDLKNRLISVLAYSYLQQEIGEDEAFKMHDFLFFNSK